MTASCSDATRPPSLEVFINDAPQMGDRGLRSVLSIVDRAGLIQPSGRSESPRILSGWSHHDGLVNVARTSPELLSGSSFNVIEYPRVFQLDEKPPSMVFVELASLVMNFNL